MEGKGPLVLTHSHMTKILCNSFVFDAFSGLRMLSDNWALGQGALLAGEAPRIRQLGKTDRDDLEKQVVRQHMMRMRITLDEC